MAKKSNILSHLAIIMDGNGRWAEKNNLPRIEGHKAGARKVKEVVQLAREANIEYLTLYAFSTENWKRSPSEVNALMGLLTQFLDEELPEMQEKGLRLRAAGRIGDLPAKVRNKLQHAIDATAKNKKGTLILALSYGGRAELVDAFKSLYQAANQGHIAVESLDESALAHYLYLPDIPDPDLIIRTSGEMRLSNFLIWQGAYSELYFTDVLWPDFSEVELQNALASFAVRERRYGAR